MAKKIRKIKKTASVHPLLAAPKTFVVVVPGKTGFIAWSGIKGSNLFFATDPHTWHVGLTQEGAKATAQQCGYDGARFVEFGGEDALAVIAAFDAEKAAEEAAREAASKEPYEPWCFGDPRGVKKTLAQREQAHKMEQESQAANTGWGGDY